MKYIFLAKNFIFMVFLAVEVTGQKSKQVFLWQEAKTCLYLATLTITFTAKKHHEDEVFLKENIYRISFENVLNITNM